MRRGARRRHRHRKNLGPTFRMTYEGRRLLPQELPIVTPELIGERNTSQMAAVRAVCEDMLSLPIAAPGPQVAMEAWGWTRKGPGVVLEGGLGEGVAERANDVPSKGEGMLGHSPKEEAESVWGDAEALIEEWFRTGEFGVGFLEEEEIKESWFMAIMRKLRAAWPRVLGQKPHAVEAA